METIGDFLALLKDSGADVTSWEAADALWLATQMAGFRTAGQEAKRPRQVSPATGTPAELTTRSTGRSRTVALRPRSAPPAHRAPVHSGQHPLPVRVPRPRELSCSLDLQRDLRPLLKNVATGPATHLDEETTAAHSAEANAVIPVLRRESERWLSLTLVIDTSPSMALWTYLAAELALLLVQLGAFRTIQVLDLRFGTNTAGVTPHGMSGRPRSPHEVVDPAGRQAFMVLTDCVSKAWRSGVAMRTLGMWARTGPLAIIQPLPQQMWPRSAVACHPVRLRSPFPGAPNNKLIVTAADHAPNASTGDGPPVPILETSPGWFASWARLITNADQADAMAAFAGASPLALAEPRTDPEAIVRRFMASASAGGFRLAGFLAATPVSLPLPLMRIVQQNMIPGTHRQQLAEVYLGGLLRPVRSGADDTARPPVYEFKEGVREVLLRTIRRSEAIGVVEFVSAELTRPGHPELAAYAAMLGLEPTGSGGRLAIAAGPSLAIESTVLDRIGGRYAQVARDVVAPPAAPGRGTASGPPPGAPPGGRATAAQATVPPGQPAGQRLPNPPPAGPPTAAPVSDGGITLWGPPASGKTTFLAALHIALLRSGMPWQLRGVDKADADALTRLTMALQDHDFPDATIGFERYNWELATVAERTVRGRFFRRARVTESLVLPLSAVDAPGGSAHPVQAGSFRWDALTDNLERSRGLLFLFDPIREYASPDAFLHTIGVVNELNQRMRGRGLTDGRLPHYVAVCVTKFDEIKVQETARTLGLVEYDAGEGGRPRVPDEYAREFFARLCEIPPSGETALIPNLLEQTFAADRIRYFVSSAIGFYFDPVTGGFNPRDYQNHLPGRSQGDLPRIRGQIRPVNVVEPILWLARNLTRAVAG